MPELPDILLYLDALDRRVRGERLERIRLGSPFLLRTVAPAPADVAGKIVRGTRRIGKRLVLEFEGDLFVVLHLMIAGRLHWRPAGAKLPGRIGLAAFDFPGGSLVLTEAGSKRRASLHIVAGAPALASLDRGGLEILAATRAEFAAALARESHTLKRALTDPRLFSGVGNAYSDEILHRARLSPFRLTGSLSDEERERLREACTGVLSSWVKRLRAETGDRFPEKVTAFREGMAVHGRFRKPCPDCGAPVQRVVYAENEANYCARCQTDGRVLADRALSRLLGSDWPKRIEDLEGRS